MLLLLTALGCGADAVVVDREIGVRAPLTRSCDDSDPARCLVPWPSNAFAAVDPDTETGIRLAVSPDALPIPDDLGFFNLGDGFSRISGIGMVFEVALGAEGEQSSAESLSVDSMLQVINIQADSERYGERMPYWTEVVDVSTLTNDRSLLVGRPLDVMEAAADHVAVVLDSVGDPEAVPRDVQLALALVEPETADEAEIVGYHAPTRAGLADAGVDFGRVVRVTEFTTRSATDPTKRLHAMMDVLDDSIDELGVEIDSVTFRSDEDLAFIVRGRLTGAPSFLDDDGRMVFDDSGDPLVVDTTAIEFRMTVPEGEGAYKVALYGHGTGGNVSDNSFDEELAAADISKLNLRFDGWTDQDFIVTITGFAAFLEGSERSTAGLLQSIAGGTVLLTALDGVLGEALTADTLAGEPNPAAGRTPGTDEVVWLGGSLGGTLGAVIVAADERLTTAVLNVPGTGWAHMIPHSLLWESGVGSILLENYGDDLDLQIAVLMAQNNWDDVDGAVWAQEALDVGGAFLLQESMGDPVLPNLGTDILASALGAVQFEPVLEPIFGLETTTGVVTSGATLEQFRVPNTGVYDVHGFAARDTIAGEAAFEQIQGLLTSSWAGAPAMEHPSICTDEGKDGTCDFTEVWDWD